MSIQVSLQAEHTVTESGLSASFLVTSCSLDKRYTLTISGVTYLTTESGDFLTTESGDRIILG